MTLDIVPAALSSVQIVGRRIGNRITSVVLGGVVNSAALEAELSAASPTAKSIRCFPATCSTAEKQSTSSIFASKQSTPCASRAESRLQQTMKSSTWTKPNISPRLQLLRTIR